MFEFIKKNARKIYLVEWWYLDRNTYLAKNSDWIIAYFKRLKSWTNDTISKFLLFNKLNHRIFNYKDFLIIKK